MPDAWANSIRLSHPPAVTHALRMPCLPLPFLRLDTKEAYIGLLKLYDLINRKLPYHVRIPSMSDVSAVQRNGPGFHTCLELPDTVNGKIRPRGAA